MPEGDTIFRAARTLRAAIDGGRVIDVRTTVAQISRLGPKRLIDQTVSAVKPRGKHLLIEFAPSTLVLHTHLGMSGSWHLYRHGERWRKGAHLARFVLDVADDAGESGGTAWTAVCFLPRVCELLSAAQVEAHPILSSLGPDALDDDVDLGEARRRLDAQPDRAIGEALLDQRVLAGVGNVYKNEVLFIHAVDPWAKVCDVDPATRDELLETSRRLLQRNVVPGAIGRITTAAPVGGYTDRTNVYGKARRPCPRCGTPIAAGRQGELARPTFWCPRCQAAAPKAETTQA